MIYHLTKKGLDLLVEEIEAVPVDEQNELMTAICYRLGVTEENATKLFAQIKERVVDNRRITVNALSKKLKSMRKEHMLLDLSIRLNDPKNKN